MYITENTDSAVYYFHQGTNYNAYDLLGCHMCFNDDTGKYRYIFRVWAPDAERVRVVGDFSSWNEGIDMKKISYGIWQAEYTSIRNYENSYYKYAVTGRNGTFLKSDPYAFSSQTLTETASVIKSLDKIKFTDDEWMSARRMKFTGKNKKAHGHFYPSPMNIYEVHLGSWRTRDGHSVSDGEHYLNYREIADELSVYVKDMGYTHIELLPIMEHPYDGSWGYQICGYYAPTSRFGSPEDFAYFVDTMHNAGIGVILDWVPAHFPKDRHGLYEFDGAPLYEYKGADRMEHRMWGTRCFDVGREEVQSFLISNALFWMRVYHIDGLRTDAVASMLYLDYDRKPGEWIPNREGNNHNLEAVSFFKKLNTAVFAEFPDVLMIAEESTAWPMITKPVHDGGLGFNFKWNMGFANDMFEYIAMNPIYRQFHHEKLTFPLMYAFSENFVLPVSHDEVVHGKKSLVEKMYGSYDEKFAMMRAYIMFMMTLPGKKLFFMGTEFAQFREWDFSNQLEWFMLKYPRHTEMQRYVKALNRLYLERPELWEIDDSWEGFRWLEADRATDNTVIFERYDSAGKSVTVVINFSPNKRANYEYPIDKQGKYMIIMNSDKYEFGGTNTLDTDFIKTFPRKMPDGSGRHIMKFDLPAYTGIIMKKVPNNFDPDKNKKCDIKKPI